MKVKKEKVKRPFRTLAIILAVLLFLECAYFFMVYTDQPTIAYWRNIYINSALSTMRHQWMATYLLPKDVVQEVIDRNTALAQQAAGKASKWEKKSNERELDAEIIEVKPMTPEEAILQMNLLEHEFFVFLNMDDNDSFSVVYKRNQGGYGLISAADV